MGRHKQTPEQIEKKKAELISLFERHSTLQSFADTLKTSRQSIQQKLKYYGILNKWIEHSVKIREILSNNISDKPGVYCLFFIQEPHKKYYGSTKNLRVRSSAHNSHLKRNVHENLCLQEMFNKYGWESLRFQTIKIVHHEQLLFEEKKLVENDSNCININNPLQTKEEYIIQQKKHCNKRYEISKKNEFFKSSHKGVTYWRLTKQWKAQPYVETNGKKKQVYLGYFDLEEDAIAAIEKYKKGVKND